MFGLHPLFLILSHPHSQLLPKVAITKDNAGKDCNVQDISDMLKCHILLRGVSSMALCVPLGQQTVVHSLMKFGNLNPDHRGANVLEFNNSPSNYSIGNSDTCNSSPCKLTVHVSNSSHSWNEVVVSALKMSIERAKKMQEIRTVSQSLCEIPV
jgi:hypothetical protein